MKNTKRVSSRPLKPARTDKRLPSKVVVARKIIRSKQPVHKRVALQPVTLLILMCIGVLLCALTFHTLADSITTNAVVPAPPLTEPATIASPADGLQTNTQALTVQGTCPDNSYVDLTDNAIFVGTAVCTAKSFQISLDLSPGSNQLQAQDYNITNSPGPQSSAITVTYNAPATPPTNNQGSGAPPIVTPVKLQVTQLDTTIPYSSSTQNPAISQQPTFAGIAPPYSRVTITLTPGTHLCTTYANSQGFWSCTMTTILPPGVYTVTVTVVTPQGETLTTLPFKVTVTETTAPQIALPPLFHITSEYLYSETIVGQPVSYRIQITGGRAPYAFTVSWGDDITSTIIRESNDTFTTSHTYGWINAPTKSRVIKIQALDASGQASTLQLETIVRNPAYIGSTAGNTKGGLGGFFNAIQPWLWLLWPGYGVTILLVFSFWLGEREELAVLMKNKTHPVNHRHIHAHGHGRQ